MIRDSRQTATTTITAPPAQLIDEGGPAAKKRKLVQQNGATTAPNTVPSSLSSDTLVLADAPLQFYVQDVSFAVPQRKKLTLEITAGPTGVLRARNQTSKEIEFGVPIDRIRESSCAVQSTESDRLVFYLHLTRI